MAKRDVKDLSQQHGPFVNSLSRELSSGSNDGTLLTLVVILFSTPKWFLCQIWSQQLMSLLSSVLSTQVYKAAIFLQQSLAFFHPICYWTLYGWPWKCTALRSGRCWSSCWSPCFCWTFRWLTLFGLNLYLLLILYYLRHDIQSRQPIGSHNYFTMYIKLKQINLA